MKVVDAKRREIESDLRGNTLRVYWYMLQKGEEVGVREVQRQLNMSSPSVASHHLSKLVDMDLVEKNAGSYELCRIIKVGVLKEFISYRGVLLPRYAFVAFFFTAYTFAYSLIALFSPISVFDRYIAIGVGLLGAAFGWFETYRLWKLKII